LILLCCIKDFATITLLLTKEIIMTKMLFKASIFLAPLLAVGCASNGDLKTVRDELASVRQTAEAAKADAAEAKSMAQEARSTAEAAMSTANEAKATANAALERTETAFRRSMRK
jgi:multidrug resistance efflux pump